MIRTRSTLQAVIQILLRGKLPRRVDGRGILATTVWNDRKLYSYL